MMCLRSLVDWLIVAPRDGNKSGDKKVLWRPPLVWNSSVKKRWKKCFVQEEHGIVCCRNYTGRGGGGRGGGGGGGGEGGKERIWRNSSFFLRYIMLATRTVIVIYYYYYYYFNLCLGSSVCGGLANGKSKVHVQCAWCLWNEIRRGRNRTVEIDLEKQLGDTCKLVSPNFL